MSYLSSLQHPLVKHLVKLRRNRAYRYEQKTVLISGIKLICELSQKFSFKNILIEKTYRPLFSYKAQQTNTTSLAILEKITGLEAPEPIAAEVCMPIFQDLKSSKRLLILDRVVDPGNLGTLLRTALAFDWDVFLVEGCVDLYNDKALRAAKGATFFLNLTQGSLVHLQSLLQKGSFSIYAADAKGDKLQKNLPKKSIALALGNESHGVNPFIMQHAKKIAIPIKKSVESLNVAIAGAIFMYLLQEPQE
ncbi:TrmH family RNA methyltransferase [Candidatus Rhabdochlamydia porcellionis]|uniref:23S rRNA (Guanosine-2'-O-)-methyltransferase RlmB n=1 Tax=Candidatus Rhabdochlamydia porcellionis TaxID=225148 RepID=A0ABX8Z5K5_9BACT|nr:RNA methyltransferase [Candidatus Rhabdochlamydia porcellionis]QZA59396.1 23S rRNA (guanosine-2'-O-)-methyltransferase RlmB [Candidatus Rhabdochlamydia porcellionis]